MKLYGRGIYSQIYSSDIAPRSTGKKACKFEDVLVGFYWLKNTVVFYGSLVEYAQLYPSLIVDCNYFKSELQFRSDLPLTKTLF